jgi:hypothetical protein
MTGSGGSESAKGLDAGGGFGSSGVHGGPHDAIEDRSIAKLITFHQAGT